MRELSRMTVMTRVTLAAACIGLSGCATVILDPGEALAVIPYETHDDGLIVIDVQVNGQGPLSFALDTGASISSIVEDAARRLGVRAVPDSLVTIHGAVASGEFPLLDVESLGVANEVWREPPVVALPGRVGAIQGVDGILGIDFMRRYTVMFSAGERVLRLFDPDSVRARAYSGWEAVPLRPFIIGEAAEPLYLFDIQINARRIPALFDLGATANLMNWPAADYIGVVPVDVDSDAVVRGAFETTEAVAELTANSVYTRRVGWGTQLFTIADLEIFSVLQYEDSPLAITGAGLFRGRSFLIDFVGNRLLVED